MIQAGVLNVLVTASTGVANAKLKATQGVMRSTAATAESSAVASRAAWLKAGAGIAAVGVIAGKLSVDFNHAMTQIETQAGAPTGEIDKLKNSVLDLSKASEFSPEELAKGLFHIESVGMRGEKAMKVLHASSELAAVGQSDLEATTYALVSALETGIKGTETMAKTTGTLNAIVGHGDMRMEDLTAALSTGLLPVAKSFGLTLTDVGGALDVFTARGTPAQAAATRLRMTMSLLGAPTAAAGKELEKIGISSLQLGETMQKKGLLPALELLRSHLKRAGDAAHQAQVITKAFGGGRTSAGITLLLQNTKDLSERMQGITKDTGKFGEAVDKEMNTPAAKLHRAWNALQVDLIKLGDILDGPASTGALALAKGLGAVIGFFDRMPDAIKKTIGAFIALRIVSAAYFSFLAKAGFEAATMGGLAASKGFAMSMATGMTRMIPIALATVGLVSIIDSATKGDMEAAGTKMGGALIGGIAGGLVGGPAGAMVGAGLGAMVGGLFQNAFDDVHIKPIHIADFIKTDQKELHKLARDSARSVHAFVQSTEGLNKAKKNTADASKRVHHWEKIVQRDRKKFGPEDDRTLKDEVALGDARRRQVRAIHAEDRAKRKHGLAAKLLAADLADELTKEKELVRNYRALTRSSKQRFKDLLAEQGMTDKTREAGHKWEQNAHALKKAQQAHNNTLQKATSKLGPKWTKQLRSASDSAGGLTHRTSRLTEVIQNYYAGKGLPNALKGTHKLQQALIQGKDSLGHGFDSVQQMAQVLIKHGLDPLHKSTDQVGGRQKWLGVQVRGAGQALVHTKGATQDLRDFLEKLRGQSSDTGRGMKHDMGTTKNVTVTSVGKIGQLMARALKQLGVNKTFDLGAHTAKRAQGGFVVPGHGVGDKVRMTADVEPHETVYVLNKHATAELSALETANQKWPRSQLQGGGLIDRTGVPHYAAGPPQLASGGFAGMQPAITNLIQNVINRFGGGMSSGYRPGDPGFHGRGEAADWVGGDWTGASRYINSIGPSLLEGIHQAPPGQQVSWDSGHPVDPSFWGAGTWAEHTSHIHMATSSAVRAIKAEIKRILISGPKGNLKSLAQGVSDKVWKAANAYLSRIAPSVGPESASGGFSAQQLEALWIQAKGPRSIAPLMAQIALAESGGVPTAYNNSGASGLWQILGALVPGDLFNPLVNAKNAVAKFRTQGLSAWDASRPVWGGWASAHGFKGGGQLGVAETIHDNLRKASRRVGKLDEDIDIAQQLAGLASSPSGEELSPGEVAKQLRLEESLLEWLKKSRAIAKRGVHVARHAIDRIDKGHHIKHLQNRVDKLQARIKDEEKKKHPDQKSIGEMNKHVTKLQTEIDREKTKQTNLKGRLNTLRQGFGEKLTEMQGLTGRGGRIFDAKIAIDELKHTAVGGLSKPLHIDELMQFAEAMRFGAFAGNLPAFARGGYHSGGLALVGEQGPEIVDMSPARVYPSGTGPGGDVNVTVKFADGMGWLRQFMDIRIDTKDRKDAAHYRAGVSER